MQLQIEISRSGEGLQAVVYGLRPQIRVTVLRGHGLNESMPVADYVNAATASLLRLDQGKAGVANALGLLLAAIQTWHETKEWGKDWGSAQDPIVTMYLLNEAVTGNPGLTGEAARLVINLGDTFAAGAPVGEGVIEKLRGEILRLGGDGGV